MAITAVPSLSALVLDYTVEPLGSGGTSVPTNRTLITTAPLTIDGGASADLSADRTFALTTSPVGQVPVGVTRLLTTTTPLRIDAGASANLSADRTLSVLPFTGAIDGMVTHNAAGVQGKYLKDDNTWGTSATAGVTSIIATAPITRDVATGDVTVGVSPVGISTSGVAPATGGADPLKYLCADLTWKVPGTSGFVTLQGSTPGTADIGHAHVTGTVISDARVSAGYATPALAGVVESYDAAGLPNFYGRSVSTFPGVQVQKARGTLAVPTASQDTDTLAAFVGTGYSSVGGWGGSISAGMFVRADGNASTSRQPSITDVLGGDVGNFSLMRQTGVGSMFKSALGAITNSDRAIATVDVQGSMALKTEVKTANFTVGATSCIFRCDATTVGITGTLPTAVGCSGRIYGFVKVDEVAGHFFDILTTSSQTISGQSFLRLFTRGESVLLQSDGANWWILASNIWSDQNTNLADGSALVNSAAETSIISANSWNGALNTGALFRWHVTGKLTTTGTPTLRFKIKNSSDFIIADSTAITMPSGVTDVAWMIEYEGFNRNLAGTTGRVSRAILHIAAASGALSAYSMISTFGNPSAGALHNYLTAQWGTASISNSVTATAQVSSVTPRTANI